MLGTIAVLFGLLVLLALGIWFLMLAFSRRRVRRVVTTTVFDVLPEEADQVVEEVRRQMQKHLQDYMDDQRMKFNLNIQAMLRQYGYDDRNMEMEVQLATLELQRSAAIVALTRKATIRVVGENGTSYVVNPTIDGQYATQVGTYNEPEEALQSVEEKLGTVTQYQEIE